MPGTLLTDMERKQIIELASLGKTPHTIGKLLNRSPHTVRTALRLPEAREQVQDRQERLADKFEQLSERILDAVCDADLEKASLQQKAVSAGVMLDKSRLIRGNSTHNLAHIFALASRPDFQD